MAAASRHDRLFGLSAEIAFFAVLSLFPALLIAAGLLATLDVHLAANVATGVGNAVVGTLDLVLTDHASGVVAAVERLFAETGGSLLTVATVVALVTLSNAFAVVIDTVNLAYGTVERRSWVIRRLLGLLLAVATTVAVVLALTVLVLGPLLGRGAELAALVGLGSAFAFAWDVLRLPVLVAGLVAWATALFHYAPSRRGRWRESLPGALLTTALWLLAGYGFRLYLDLAAAVNPVLGAFGGGVIVMIWVYLLSLALLLGGELNATLHHRPR